MPLFTKNPKRVDPYKNFMFVVSWDKKPVLGVNKVSALTRTTQVLKHRAGGDPRSMRVSPGQTEYSPLRLEQGLTFDPGFEQWANKVWYYKNTASLGGKESSLSDFRKDVTIELYNEAGQKVMRYFVYRCWVSEYTAMPELDANHGAVAIQSVVLENEGWERDDTLAEPKEPSFTFPQS